MLLLIFKLISRVFVIFLAHLNINKAILKCITYIVVLVHLCIKIYII
jgi:hypothetical protein